MNVDAGTNRLQDHAYVKFMNKKIDDNELVLLEKVRVLTVHETKFKEMAELLDLPVAEGRHSLLEGLRANLRPLMEQSAEDIANRISKE